MKKFILFSFIVFFVFGAGTIVLAEDRKLEIDYPAPPGGGFAPETVGGTDLPNYVRYIFNFAIAIAGLLALGVIIMGGARRVISAGNSTAISEGNSQITSGLLGLGILLSSWLLLTTINPQLVIFKDLNLLDFETGKGPGVWLCKNNKLGGLEPLSLEAFSALLTSKEPEDQKKIGESCYKADIVNDVPEKFKGKDNKGISNDLTYFYLIDGDAGTKYGAVLYSEAGLRGDCQVITADGTKEGTIEKKLFSVAPFILNSSPQGNGVKLYRNPDLNTLDLREIDPKFDGTVWPSKESYYGISGSFINVSAEPIRSIEISGQYIAVVNSKGSGSGLCQAFNKNDYELTDRYVGTFCSPSWWEFWKDKGPCVYSLRVVGGEILGSLNY